MANDAKIARRASTCTANSKGTFKKRSLPMSNDSKQRAVDEKAQVLNNFMSWFSLATSLFIPHELDENKMGTRGTKYLPLLSQVS